MGGNVIGSLFRVTTFGESHGKGIGAVIDGCPAGLPLDIDYMQAELDRRRPGQSAITTPRDEKDKVIVFSGVHDGKTIGSPITLLIYNEDHRPGDYDHLVKSFRPSHADYTYQAKYGETGVTGGGRSSARETAARVAAGAVAKMLLRHYGIQVRACVTAIGPVKLPIAINDIDFTAIEQNIVRCPHTHTASQMLAYIEKIKAEGDTCGGLIICAIDGVPPGLGEPVFDRLHADLAKAVMSINAVKGFEIGSGFAAAGMTGSAHNDDFIKSDAGNIKTKTNHSGGVQGGLSNGEQIYFNVAFKPVSTLMRPQNTMDAQGNEVVIEGKGRHDPCVVPRAVPIVEAMAAITIADHFLRNQTSKLQT